MGMSHYQFEHDLRILGTNMNSSSMELVNNYIKQLETRIEELERKLKELEEVKVVYVDRDSNEEYIFGPA
jgi:hypothetical protein